MRKLSSSNTGNDSQALDVALGNIPDHFRKKIIEAYLDIKHRSRVGDVKGSAASHTHFCESTLRFLQETLTQKHIPFGTHIGNFQDECRKLETVQATPINEAQRVIIPRALAFLHTLRNKRGTGHVGGDVDANAIDLITVARVADWIVCELLRLYHRLSLEEAQSLLDKLSTRQMPDVWIIGETKRVLRTDLKAKDRAMLLLYGETSPVAIETLHGWMEYSTQSVFRRDVIKPLHDGRLIECEAETDMLTLSPSGEVHVERKLLI
jgi:hypothetical protein